MKVYTDLGQSRKLAKILPLESADMHYNNVSIKGINYVDAHRAELMDYNTAQKVLSKYLVNPLFEVIPCWSLAALLGVLPEVSLNSFKDGKWNAMVQRDSKMIYADKDNPVDACVEMILKLHELKLI